MTQFYSYLWLREDGTPWYAGKGSGKRAFKRHGKFWPPKDRNLILIFPRSTEAAAFATEIELIRNWGRLDIGTGCLYNRTPGGEDPPRGRLKGRKLSEAHKLKLAAAKKGKRGNHTGFTHSVETRQKMSKPRSHSWTLSEETRRAQSTPAVAREAKKKEQGIHCGQVFGYKHTDEAKHKISEAKKGKPSWNSGVPMSEETRALMSLQRKGKPWSEARRQKHAEKKLCQILTEPQT